MCGMKASLGGWRNEEEEERERCQRRENVGLVGKPAASLCNLKTRDGREGDRFVVWWRRYEGKFPIPIPIPLPLFYSFPVT